MYILSEDAFRMHPSYLKMAILSCVYQDRIALLQRQANEVAPSAKSLPAGREKENRRQLFYDRAPSPAGAKKWRGPSPKNRALSQELGLGKNIDLLA